MLQYVCMGSVKHDVSVTFDGGLGGWICTVFVNGNANQSALVRSRTDIGAVCRDLLRWEDKCGNTSDWASSARRRGREDRDVRVSYL